MTDGFGGVDAATWEQLHEAALAVHRNAHAPYSEFHVGAALLTDAGEIVVGVNVENATFGATVCAERTAVGTAVTQGVRRFKALCVLTHADRPVAPCGICRQVLAEFCHDLPVLMATVDGQTETITLNELLPHRFGEDDF